MSPVSGNGHVPVMVAEVVEALAPRDQGIYVDGTFGGGGYSRAVLEAAMCQVMAIDRDPEAIARGEGLVRDFPERIELIGGRFGEMERLLPAELAGRIDGVALDLGVSSRQLADAGRGFSFQTDGPLDMRMDGHGSDTPSAADVVNGAPERELADIIWRYGEERRARRVAASIVEARREKPIERTSELAGIVRRAVGSRGKHGIDPATRTFQALRIHVNDELGELRRGLTAAERLLAPGGRLAVVAFHSLEDRGTKTFLSRRCGLGGRGSRHMPDAEDAEDAAARAPSFRLVFKGARKPGAEECQRNPRARSARLRAAERTDAAPWLEEALS